MNLASSGAAALLLQALLWPHTDLPDDALFDELARRWLTRNAVEAPARWPELLERRFVRLALGAFDVYLPSSALEDGKARKDASAALLALLDAQDGWTAWSSGRPPAARGPDPLSSWIRGLSQRPLDGRRAAGAELAELAEADPAVRAALDRYRTEQRGSAEEELAGVRLVIFPRRCEFVEFTCVAGALDERLKPSAWNEGLAVWLEYQADDTRFLALEYTASPSGRDLVAGIPVGERNAAALPELVAQVAIRSLAARRFGDGLDPALVSGMANALVIDLYGELDTRIDGDVRARSSQGRSVFVPGGNPNGGVLPATSAENRWRGSKGEDHFVGILSQVQKQSGKKARTRPEKLASFELVSDDGSRKELVRAPFLGAGARAPGAEVFPDYLELVRCYGIAFLHWLRLEGAGPKQDSAARFGELLRALERGPSAEELPGVFAGLYGQPLSGASTDDLFAQPTLEGRFLAWLAKR